MKQFAALRREAHAAFDARLDVDAAGIAAMEAQSAVDFFCDEAAGFVTETLLVCGGAGIGALST